MKRPGEAGSPPRAEVADQARQGKFAACRICRTELMTSKQNGVRVS